MKQLSQKSRGPIGTRFKTQWTMSPPLYPSTILHQDFVTSSKLYGNEPAILPFHFNIKIFVTGSKLDG